MWLHTNKGNCSKISQFHIILRNIVITIECKPLPLYYSSSAWSISSGAGMLWGNTFCFAFFLGGGGRHILRDQCSPPPQKKNDNNWSNVLLRVAPLSASVNLHVHGDAFHGFKAYTGRQNWLYMQLVLLIIIGIKTENFFNIKPCCNYILSHFMRSSL